MGVLVYENICCTANISDDDDDDEYSNCYDAMHTVGNNETELQQKLNIKFSKKHNTTTTTSTTNILSAKDLVGNSKEFRIENNKCNLRIIGNSNRIRITNNFGNLQIIGNSTKLKINKNNGYIKFTGNDGRICLGSESTQQTVDYIGCNGLLKVINSMEFNKTPQRKNACGHENEAKTTKINIEKQTKTTIKTKTTNNLPGNVSHASSTFSTASSSLITNSPIIKSTSSDSINDFKNAKWQEFNNLLSNKNGWQHFAKVSLPNLKENFNEPSSHCGLTCDCKCKKKNTFLNNNTNSKRISNNQRNHTNVVNNFGDIIISNSVNIRIS